MEIIRGNLLNIERGIVVHQVNCMRKAGKGLALQIRKRYLEWYSYFLETKPIFGTATLFRVSDDLYIGSLYSQRNYGNFGQHTNYEALALALDHLKSLNREGPDFNQSEIYFPYMIGCGLGGGDWKIVKVILNTFFPRAKIVRI